MHDRSLIPSHSFFAPAQTPSSKERIFSQKLQNAYRMVNNWASTAMAIATFDPEFYANPKDISYTELMVGFACVAAGLTTHQGRQAIAGKLLENTSAHAIKIASSRLTTTINSATKLLRHFNQPETSQQKEAQKNICKKRFLQIELLVKTKQIPHQVVNTISDEHLYMIVCDSPETDVSLFKEELLLVMELATRLGCHHIPTKILEQFHDLHHEDYLRLCIEAKNVTMFKKTLQMSHLNALSAFFSMESVFYTINSRVILPCSALSGIMSLYQEKPLLSRDDMVAFTLAAAMMISIHLLGSAVLEFFVIVANNCADEDRYLLSRTDMIHTAQRLNLQEIAALCIQNNPFLLDVLSLIDTNMTKKIVEEMLLHPSKLERFVKNVSHYHAEQIVLPCLKSLFPDAQDLQDASNFKTFCEQAAQHSKALKDRMKTLKLLGQHHFLFSALPRNVMDSHLLPRLSDETILSEQSVTKMIRK